MTLNPPYAVLAQYSGDGLSRPCYRWFQDERSAREHCRDNGFTLIALLTLDELEHALGLYPSAGSIGGMRLVGGRP